MLIREILAYFWWCIYLKFFVIILYITLFILLIILSHILWRIFCYYIIKNRPEFVGRSFDETKLKLDDHFDVNWSLSPKIKKNHNLILYQKNYPYMLFIFTVDGLCAFFFTHYVLVLFIIIIIFFIFVRKLWFFFIYIKIRATHPKFCGWNYREDWDHKMEPKYRRCGFVHYG